LSVRPDSRRRALLRLWTWSLVAAAVSLPLLAGWLLQDPERAAWNNAQAEMRLLTPRLQLGLATLREELLAGTADADLLYISALDAEGKLLSPPRVPKAEALEESFATSAASGWYYEGIRKLAQPTEALAAFEEARQAASAEDHALLLQVDLAKAQLLRRLDRSEEALPLLQEWWQQSENSWTLRGKPVGLQVGYRLLDTLEALGRAGQAQDIRAEMRRRLLSGRWPLTEAEVIQELRFLTPTADGESLPELSVGLRRDLHFRDLLQTIPLRPTAPAMLLAPDGLLLVDAATRRVALYPQEDLEHLLDQTLQALLPTASSFRLAPVGASSANSGLPSAFLAAQGFGLPGWRLLLADLEPYLQPLRFQQRLLLFAVSLLSLSLLGLMIFGRRLLAREQALQRTRTEFLAGVSHELRTPAASLSLLAGNLLQGRVAPGERTTAYYQAMKRDARRLERLVADVLDVTRMDRGSFSIERTPCQLEPILEALVADQAPRLQDAGIQLELVLEGNAPTLSLDAFAVERACANLLENIRRYAAAGGWAELRLRKREDGGVELRVSDRGPGIPVAWCERIFQAYERLPQDQEMAAGAGLGLALVQAVLQAHGGRIHVEPGPDGRGACFVMSFPADV